jgi:hypothetical protein
VGGLSFQKQEATCLEHHGVKRGFVRPDVLQRTQVSSHTPQAEARRRTSLKAWHQNRPVDWQNAGNSPEASAKRHETMKRNGTYRKSSTEDAMYAYLCGVYGLDQVQRNVWMNGKWPIDFYVKPINTYMQLDGVYWHGLNRPIEVIKQFKKPRDVKIYRKWLTDREQNEWFRERDLKLVRLTDLQFKTGVRP